MSKLEILTLESMPFAENSYLLWRAGSTETLVVDPGFQPELIFEALEDRGLSLVAILNTHGHADHIAGNGALKKAFPQAPLFIGTGDAAMLRDPNLNLSSTYGFNLTSPPAEQLLNDGEKITLAGIEMEILEIPGHSPGHIVFVIRENPLIVIGGDVLFRGSIGRTDFPGGSFEQLRRGIHEKLWPLPADTVVYPGHGPTTTTGYEKRTNPYVGDGASHFRFV